jgi:hypothetical protein
MKLTQKEIKIAEFMKANEITTEEVIDVVIKCNGLIGVGLITLEDEIKKHIKSYHDTSIWEGEFR